MVFSKASQAAKGALVTRDHAAAWVFQGTRKQNHFARVHSVAKSEQGSGTRRVFNAGNHIVRFTKTNGPGDGMGWISSFLAEPPNLVDRCREHFEIILFHGEQFSYVIQKFASRQLEENVNIVEMKHGDRVIVPCEPLSCTAATRRYLPRARPSLCRALCCTESSPKRLVCPQGF